MPGHQREPGGLPQPVPAAGTMGEAWGTAGKPSGVAQEWRGAAELGRMPAVWRGWRCTVRHDAPGRRSHASSCAQQTRKLALPSWWKAQGDRPVCLSPFSFGEGPCCMVWWKSSGTWVPTGASQILEHHTSPLAGGGRPRSSHRLACCSNPPFHSHWCCLWKSIHLPRIFLWHSYLQGFAPVEPPQLFPVTPIPLH